MQEVGWPEPAAVVAIMESTLRRLAFSLIASMAEVDGAATVVVLIGSPLVDLIAESKCDFTRFGARRRAALSILMMQKCTQRGQRK
jgi:hypothetical protein